MLHQSQFTKNCEIVYIARFIFYVFKIIARKISKSYCEIFAYKYNYVFTPFFFMFFNDRQQGNSVLWASEA